MTGIPKVPDRASLRAIGLMSGTSMDGIDAAIIETDGNHIHSLGDFISLSYTNSERAALRGAIEAAAVCKKRTPDVAAISDAERMITARHTEAVKALMDKAQIKAADIDVIGFHGHTVIHRPDQGWTWQIGDGASLSRRLDIPVIANFRGRDMQAGGQGAPLIPLYHDALLRRDAIQGPVAVLNIGGVANVSWLDPKSDGSLEAVAFDTGPGGAMLDDWVRQHLGKHYDEDGALAARGLVQQDVALSLLDHPYFDALPPKALDRNDFPIAALRGLSPENGAATLIAFVVGCIIAAQAHFPAPVRQWYVCGGGRHNTTLMAALSAALPVPVMSVDALGWRGDAVEAEGFGYLAVRALKGLPLTVPATTGCRAPTTGGTLYFLENTGA